MVATFGTRHGSTPPEWSHDLPVLTAADPESHIIDELVTTLDGVERDLPRQRDRILSDTLAELAAHPQLTEIVEPALSVGWSPGRP